MFVLLLLEDSLTLFRLYLLECLFIQGIVILLESFVFFDVILQLSLQLPVRLLKLIDLHLRNEVSTCLALTTSETAESLLDCISALESPSNSLIY